MAASFLGGSGMSNAATAEAIVEHITKPTYVDHEQLENMEEKSALIEDQVLISCTSATAEPSRHETDVRERMRRTIETVESIVN